jgi:RNA polymerase sigma-70 factor (ECF subfamily)
MTDDSVPPHREGESAEPTSSLLVRVRSQDQEAWRRLVAMYAPLVYRWCRAGGLTADAAADVGQEVFLAVATSIAGFRRDRPGDSFRGWMRVITRNKVRDYHRQMPVVGLGDDANTVVQPMSDEPPDAETDTEERSTLYRKAIELIQTDFEEQTWQAFWKVVIDDQTPADVAAELGMTANAVYLAKARVLRRLREELADLEDL